MITYIGVTIFAYMGEKSKLCVAKVCWVVLFGRLMGCSDLEGIQLVCLLCYQCCISSSFNSISALGGSCLILLPKIVSAWGGELQRMELFRILGLNIDDGGDRWFHF